MSRYRPPQPTSTPIITPEGFQALQEEHDTLRSKTRPEVVKALSAAAAEGDRSENAEYIYRKKQLREIDRRLRYLMKRLEVLKVAGSSPTDASKIYFGAWVELADEAGNEVEYRIVGPDEWDVDKGWISIDSPVARGLMTKTEGDEVCVDTPNGQTRWEVLSVRYGS